VIFFSKENLDQAQELERLLDVPAILVNAPSLREVAAVISRCDLFVGADSGLAHLAASVACPSVIVSCHPVGAPDDHANSPKRFAPLAPYAVAVQPDRPLQGCENGCVAREPHCIDTIDANRVTDAIKAVLGKIAEEKSRPSGSY
jgi:ADP-heptose:LPS heptosyltransferase